jgi:rhamnosyltransferase
MKVAVLLAAYNGKKYIEEQILSIINQKNNEIIIYISIDLSSDETYSICKNLEYKYSNIKILPYGSIYGSAAQNFFRLILDVNIEDFDYITFSDQDDIWFPDKISTAINKIANTNISCYSCDVLAQWPNGKIKLLKKSYPQQRFDYFFESAGPGCTYLFKIEFGLILKKFISNNYILLNHLGSGQHDWFIYAFARKNNYKWLIDDYVGMYYRQHSNNFVGANYGFYSFIYRIKVVLSGWAFSQALLLDKIIISESDKFVINNLRKGRLGFIIMLFNSSYCRRRPRDRIFFSIACLWFVFKGFKF